MIPGFRSFAVALLPLALALEVSGQAAGGADAVSGTGAAGRAMVEIGGGRFVSQYAVRGREVAMEPFRLDPTPVTVGDFLAFVEADPEWRRAAVPPVFADGGYLSDWASALDPGDGDRRRPVTGVSWFAARAYCDWRGARLPTTHEWEYAARASEESTDAFRDPAFNRLLMELQQARPRPGALPPVGRTFRNAWGVWDLHGLVWEWTSDFNSQMATGSARNDRGIDRGLYCAAGALGATDMTDYVAFLRWSFRASLEGSSTAGALGFRCAAS